MDLSELTRRTLSRRDSAEDPLRIVQAGHPALRDHARAYAEQLDPELLGQLAEAMVITMRDAPGVGLAAPQVGIPLQLVVIEDRVDGAEEGGEDDDDDVLGRENVGLRVLLNPEYEAVDTRRAYYWEGCLSVDGWQSIVPRHLAIDWSALELSSDGSIEEVGGRWTGWPARIIQHETDHLAGTLCHDLAVPRSFVEARYTAHYADLAEAVRRLGLSGEVAELAPGQVEIG